MKSIRNLLESEKGELSSLGHDVLESLQRHETLSRKLDAEFDKDLTFGDKMADRPASFGGSWISVNCTNKSTTGCRTSGNAWLKSSGSKSICMLNLRPSMTTMWMVDRRNK